MAAVRMYAALVVERQVFTVTYKVAGINWAGVVGKPLYSTGAVKTPTGVVTQICTGSANGVPALYCEVEMDDAEARAARQAGLSIAPTFSWVNRLVGGVAATANLASVKLCVHPLWAESVLNWGAMSAPQLPDPAVQAAAVVVAPACSACAALVGRGKKCWRCR